MKTMLFVWIALIVASAPLLAEEKPKKGGALLLEPKPLDNMHHLMEYVFEPPWKRLKQSMAEEVNSKEGWSAVKGDALTLAEATNLLFNRLPDEKPESWKKLAAQVRSNGSDFYQAARAKDYPLARKHYQTMLTSCNKCHDAFADGDYQLKPF